MTVRLRQLRAVLAVALAVAATALATPGLSLGTQGPLHSACTQATIQGKSKCIAAGQYCRHSKAANQDYHRYGYYCGKRDKNGRYHLRHYYG